MKKKQTQEVQAEFVDTAPKGCCSPGMKTAIEEMFTALPAPSVDAIATRMNTEPYYVSSLLVHLRAHPVQHGWTVPHAKRGRPTGEDKFVAQLVDTKGRPYLEEATIAMVQGGLVGTVKEVARKNHNEARALRMVANQVKSRRVASKLRDYADDLDYQARKAESVLSELVDEYDAPRNGAPAGD